MEHGAFSRMLFFTRPQDTPRKDQEHTNQESHARKARYNAATD